MHIITFTLQSVALFFCVVQPVCAENVSLFGVPFPVEELTQVDTGQLQVRVLGETEIVAEEDLKEHVANKYFSSSTKIDGVSSKQWLEFLRQGIANQDTRLLVECVPYIADKLSSSPYDTRLVFSTLSDSPAGKEVIKFSFTSPIDSYPRSVALELLMAMSSDAEWVKGIVGSEQRHRPGYEKIFWSRVEEHIAKEEWAEVVAIARTCFTLLGREATSCAEAQEAHSLLKDLDSLTRDNFDNVLTAVVSRSRSFGPSRKWFEPAVRNKVVKFTKDLIAEGDHKRAFSALAFVPSTGITPVVAKLGRDLLTMHTQEELLSLPMRPRNFLLFLRRADPTTNSYYLRILESQFFETLKKKEVEDARTLLGRLLLEQDVSSEKRDRMRFALAMGFRSAGNYDRAKQLISEMSSMEPDEMARTALSGLYISIWLVIPVILLPLFAIVAWILAKRLSSAMEEKKAQAAAQAQMDTSATGEQTSGSSSFEEPDELPMFSQRIFREDPRLREMRRLVELLGVPGDVDIRDIKSAYRRKIRVLHPDSGREQTEETQKQFLELQELYEKIMDLRRQLNLPT